MMDIPEGATHYNKNESNLFYKIVAGFYFFWSPSSHKWMECGDFQEGFIENLVRISDPSKLERLRDEFAMAVITGIYSNPNRTGTCIDALKQAYELASQVHHVRDIKNG